MSVSSPSTPTVKKPLLSDRAYNVLKHVASVGLPAVSTLYFALAQIWYFPHTEQVIGTIAAVNVFVGALVGLSTLTYSYLSPATDVTHVGTIEVTDDGTKKLYSLNLDVAPESLESMSTATFKVNPVQTAPFTPLNAPDLNAAAHPGVGVVD